jgi:hypothetical protein
MGGFFTFNDLNLGHDNLLLFPGASQNQQTHLSFRAGTSFLAGSGESIYEKRCPGLSEQPSRAKEK